MGCAKAFLFFFNAIYLGISGLLVYLAVWLMGSYKDYNKILTDTYTIVPAGIVVAVGCLIFVTALIGCCGTCRESKCCLSIFFILLLIVFSMEIAAGVLGAVYKNQAKADVKKGLDEAISHYNDTGKGLDIALDFLQKKFECCGDNSPNDWKKTAFYKQHFGRLPESCCRDHGTCKPSMLDHNHYTDGCYDTLLTKLDNYLTYIIGIGIGFALLQLFGMVASCFVMCKSGEVSYAPLNGGTFV